MDLIVKHAGVSALSILGASAVTIAAAINPVGAAIFVTGFALWLNEQRRN